MLNFHEGPFEVIKTDDGHVYETSPDVTRKTAGVGRMSDSSREALVDVSIEDIIKIAREFGAYLCQVR